MAKEKMINNDNKITHYVFVKNDRRHYAPRYLSAGEITVRWIFSVPEPNAVGTLDGSNNGIAIMLFGDDGTELN